MDSINYNTKMIINDQKRTSYRLAVPRTFLSILFIIFAFQPINALERLNELEWSSRIILIRAIGESEEALEALREFDDEIQERDLYWFVFKKENIETNYIGEIQENFHSDILKNYFIDTETNVVLIGKDGRIKRKLNNLDLQDIFGLIDTMPMRQMEMRERN